MKAILILFLAGAMFGAEAPKVAPAAVKLTDAEKAQLYKALAAAANAQTAAMQAEAAAKAKVDELSAIRKQLETKCGTALTEESGLADCSVPVVAKK